ncbi:MAG: hypothetical protein KJ070_05835 [Verrucomicrobia bacterium]|nr:hypothetical protein [Verrucomicrobiota bacterium]
MIDRNGACAVICCISGGLWGRMGKAVNHRERTGTLPKRRVYTPCQPHSEFRQWALDYGDRFPFNLSTNEGGTLEVCAPDKDGFDASAAWHFQVLSNELNTPVILVCPKDKTRKPAKDFASLLPASVTYRVRSGTNVSDAHPKEILVVCPVDGNTLYCDGSVKEGKRK